MATKKSAKHDHKKELFRMETITLMKDDYRYTDDVTVTYNGVNYQIKRGVPVQVPRVIKLILEDSARQNIRAAEFSKGLEDSFYQKTERVARGLKVN